MGSWDESCSLTGAAIHSGDPCIMVVTKLPKKPLTWESHFGLFRDNWDFKRVTHIAEGKYNDYGGLEECPRSDDFDEEATFFFTADGWKWALEEYKRIDDLYMRNIDRNLFDPFEDESDKNYHKVMEKINAERVANGESPIESYIPRHKYPERINEFYLVSALCTILRRPLALPASGPQFGFEYRETQLRYLDHVKKFVLQQYDKDKLDEAEWKDDD